MPIIVIHLILLQEGITFMDAINQSANLLLVWIGFGTLVGLLAKAILPGKDPGGALPTVIIGILGSVIGAATLAYFSENLRVSPISPLGFIVAIVGTTVLLFGYRILHGNVLANGIPGLKIRKPRRRISVTEEKVA